MPKQNDALINETAAELLKAIKEAAPSANDRGNEALESLARAYSLVVSNALQQPGSGRAAIL